MAVNHFDLIVLGSGPAGERGAAYAAALGRKVALVEREGVLGGTVANLGTLPSKTLREAAVHLAGFRQRGIQGVNLSIQEQMSTPDLLYRERLVRQLEQARIRAVIDQNKIDVYHGEAVFVDTRTVRVRSAGGAAQDELLSADKILIATGSRPWRSPQFQIEDPAVLDSETILGLGQIPRQLVVVGGGVIGTEYASIFAAFGVQVTLIEEGESLMPFLDRELSAALLSCLRAQGIDVRLGEVVRSVERGKPLRLQLAKGGELDAEVLLVCTGRVGNSASLGLSAAGLETDARGFISVNEHGETHVSGVYAAGDVRGFPALASAAREQAVGAMRHAFGGDAGGGGSGIPLYGIYTIPECSMAGETEEGLKAKGTPFISGIAHYPANTRGQILGARIGFVKLLFHRESQLLLGVHIIGEMATELVHIGTTAMQARAKAKFFTEGSYNYPTLGELYKAATLDALGKLKPAKSPGRLLGPR